jgi:hypothetical protein
MKRLLWGAALGASLFIIHSALADTTSILAPNGEGYSLQWTPSAGTTHYTLVDEAVCNGTTDYVRTTTLGQRDAYAVSLSSIPDGSTITAVDIKPCASRNNSGGGSATLNVFSRLNGVNSADSGAYALPTGTTPLELATTTISVSSTVKNASTTLQIGSVYSSGTKGIRLSKIVSRVTYTPLSAPTGLSASSSVSTSTLITLSWTDNATNEDGYKIERGLSTSSFSEIATIGSSSVSYSDGTVSPATTYYYRVRAYNTGGNSGYSNTANATTILGLNAPSGLSGVQDPSAIQINLSWTDNSIDETAFVLERKLSSDFSYTQLATTSASATSYADSAVTGGSIYNYRIRGYNAGAYGPYSNVATATAPLIAYDNAAQYTACVTGTSCTYSYTVTGTNTFLACMNINYNTPAGTTTMTYNGVPMTHLGAQQVDSTSPDTSTMDTFYLAGATTGTHDIVITTANSMTNGFYAHCASYTGVDQLSPISTSTQHITPYPTTNSDSAMITTTYNNEWVVGFWGDHAGRTHSAGSNTTQRIQDGQGAVEDSGGPVVTPSSKTITVTTDANTGLTLTAFGLKSQN